MESKTEGTTWKSIKTILKTGVKSDVAFCFWSSIEKTNSDQVTIIQYFIISKHQYSQFQSNILNFTKFFRLFAAKWSSSDDLHIREQRLKETNLRDGPSVWGAAKDENKDFKPIKFDSNSLKRTGNKPQVRPKLFHVFSTTRPALGLALLFVVVFILRFKVYLFVKVFLCFQVYLFVTKTSMITLILDGGRR